MEGIPNLKALFEDNYINFGSSLVVDSGIWPDSNNYLSSSVMPPEDDEENCNGNFHGDYEKYPPQPSQSHQNSQRIHSSVYDYYKVSPSFHQNDHLNNHSTNLNLINLLGHDTRRNNIGILRKNISNLNKHHICCVGCFSVWETKCPGLIDPNLGAKMEAEESDTVMKDLVKALVAIQVSFSIFKKDQLQSILQQIFPGFPWPKRHQIASLASQLYYESKQAIIDEV
ncbi:hypothetical protein O181_023582 [Austropuccinia psidii MF-1]|uniref:Uncharacterized protein n=1 Tax=Austropuccinia psidii MF-1 TaxID=1389203 RepID=A0A9Q3GY58_9BASI|nr:hypothetical protein [Austropuccinia psidii MF-1]